MNSRLKRLFSFSIILLALSSCAKPVTMDSLISSAVIKERLILEKTGPQLCCREATNEEILKDLGDPSNLGNIKVLKLEDANFPLEKKYTLFLRKLDGSMSALGVYSANEELKLVSCEDELPLSKFTVCFGSFYPGEEISFVLLSEDSEECFVALSVPNPIAATWDDGAKISLTSFSPKMDGFFFQGTDFSPDEILRMESVSEGERIVRDFPVNPDGTFISIMMPATLGKRHGDSQLVVKRKATGEVCTLNYTYGIPPKKIVKI